MGITQIFDRFKADFPDLAEKTASYKANMRAANGLLIALVDGRVISYEINAKETVIRIPK